MITQIQILEKCPPHAFVAEGALIQTIATVDEALNVMSAFSPDILINEIYLPDKIEYLLLAQLRNLEVFLGR
ncbi:hypothetical protein H6G91_19770 [Nostoc muscorum FACHB-395]|nr:hypothetical protein [Desmonostoc muscorum FACHB-395]